MLNGSTKPHAFSWFVWSLPTAIVFVAQLMKGGGAGSWATGLSLLLCTIIFVLCYWHGERDITRVDIAALTIGIIAILLWVVTDDPLDAVLLTTLADLIGFVPTARKSFAKPYEETASTYVVSVAKWSCSLLAMGSLTMINVFYGAAMIAANALMVMFLMYRRYRVRHDVAR